MGQIGRFIDHCCEHHPHLMRAVLEKPLAPLGSWLQWDECNRLCGCLIGTSALAAGFQPHGTARPRSIPLNDGEAIDYVANVLEWTYNEVSAVGMAVFYASERLSREHDYLGPVSSPTSDARVVHLLRTRIARQLAVRESALPIETRLPNEPVERSVSVEVAR